MDGMVGEQPELYSGHVACGPVVSAAPAFTHFLKKRDRKYLAIEMESAGVLAAASERLNQPATIVIRGISDFADERKAHLDNTGGGAFRYVAMHNAVKLLCCVLASIQKTTPLTPNPEPTAITCTPVKSASPCIDTTSIALRADSVHRLIDALESHFSFRWEPGSYPAAPSSTAIVYWPVRLRHPTPIHAVQTFAAAALSRMNLEVVLCLDDLGNKDHSPDDFVETIKRWWRRVGASAQFKMYQFSQILHAHGEGALDPWPIARKWLGDTHRKLDDILRISKLMAATDTEHSSLAILGNKRPRRLLNPPIVWACMRHIATTRECDSIITLGGHDERPLWDAWRTDMADRTLKVGHLYIPTLGETPLHMAQNPLHWNSQEDIRESLQAEIETNPDGWLSPNGMIRWSLSGCVALPDFVGSGCSQVSVLSIRQGVHPATLVQWQSGALADRLLKHA
jgi:hypothetical protein